MPSQTRETREHQLKLYDQLIENRRADLQKKGLTPKEFDKDNVYEHLKAKRRAIVNAMAAFDAVKARHEQPKEAPAEQPPPAPAPAKEKKPKKVKS